MQSSDDARDSNESKREAAMTEAGGSKAGGSKAGGSKAGGSKAGEREAAESEAAKADKPQPGVSEGEESKPEVCKQEQCKRHERKPEASKPCSFVDSDWIQKVFKTIDTPLRTHRITLSYSMFAACLDTKLFGTDSLVDRTSKAEEINVGNANWFNFATWGTYTLGPNIRNDGAPQRLDSLPNSIRRRIAPAIIQSRSAHGDVVGRALAWGQELIFLSASRALLRFVTMKGNAFNDTFRMPPTDREYVLNSLNWSGIRFVDKGHLELVDEAFDCYRLVLLRAAELAAKRTAPDQRPTADEIQLDPYVARLLFLATCLLTAAEQDVVNRALAIVIESVPERWKQAVDGKLSQLANWRSGVPQQVAAYNLLAQLRTAQDFFTESWARLMTKYLLVIVLPTEMLRLGRNVPLRNPTEPMFPLPLMDLSVSSLDHYEPKPTSHPEAIQKKLVRLEQFVSTLDRSQSGIGSAAHDWRRFDDRMNWAICLFRSRQQDRTLYWPPYSVEDTRRIVAGEMPRASGHPGQAAVMPPLDPASFISAALEGLPRAGEG